MNDTTDIKQALVQTYNNYAEERGMKSSIEPWKVEERAGFLQVLRKNSSTSLLEIGAGPGRDSLFFKEQGFEVTCTDLSPEMVRICKDRGLDAHVMDYYEMDFADATFDAVYAMNCLLHVPKSQLGNVLGEIRRVLKPQGLLYMGVYGGYEFEGIWEQDIYEPKRFFSFFSDEKMKELVEEYYHIESFKVVKYQQVGLHFQSMVLQRT
jgi:SAM-dependent methyltransferase